MTDTLIEEHVESAEDAAFRAELEGWLRENPAPVGGAGGFAQDDAVRAASAEWQRDFADAGYIAVTYPKAYGGRGGTTRQQAIVGEELAGRGAVIPAGIGVSMVAPTILAHGTDEQKEQFLLPTLRGDLAWCQLYSEPGAGSDLAGLSTRAERDGDEWIVNGQKVWTTQAHIADYAILLARTDPDQPKHRGITYFLIDMHQPGIEVRPLRQLTGEAHFNEVFLTDARVPHHNVLGDVNGGWGVSMTTLLHERMLMSGTGGGSGGGGGRQGKIERMIELAARMGKTSDPVVRQGLADGYIRSQLQRYLGLRLQAARGGPSGPHPSLLKLNNAWLQKRLDDLALSILGPTGTLWAGDAPDNGAWQQDFLTSIQLRIAGGTDQVQLNVIGERVLGLPPEPRADKDIPFRDVPNNAARR